MKIPTVLIAATLAATPALAQSPAQGPHPIVVYGYGSVTCQTWLSEPQDGADHIAHQQWLLGFLSGYNMFIAYNEGTASDNSGITGWLDARYCPVHPNDTIATAGAWLVDDMRVRLNATRLWPAPPTPTYTN